MMEVEEWREKQVEKREKRSGCSPCNIMEVEEWREKQVEKEEKWSGCSECNLMSMCIQCMNTRHTI